MSHQDRTRNSPDPAIRRAVRRIERQVERTVDRVDDDAELVRLELALDQAAQHIRDQHGPKCGLDDLVDFSGGSDR